MKRLVVPALALLVGCSDDAPTPPAMCTLDTECAVGLRCVDGLCVRPFIASGSCANLPGRPPTSTQPISVRVFALGQRITPESLESPEAYAENLRQGVNTFVQRNLARDRTNVLVFPDVSRVLPFVGARSAPARSATTLATAYEALSAPYATAIAHYRDRGSSTRTPVQLRSLALTDTVWRSLDAAYVSMARTFQSYVVVTAAVAVAQRTSDVATVAALAPSGSTEAWVASGDVVYRQTLVFDPTGALVMSVAREVLDDSDTALGLTPGMPASASPRRLAFGPVAVLSGGDAAEPDLQARAERAELVLGPESFEGYAQFDPPEGWSPDRLKSARWAALMRNAARQSHATACLSGNLFDARFDCQSNFFVAPGRVSVAGRLLGQDLARGIGEVAAWAVDDPVDAPLSERRTTLSAYAETLRPGGTNANAYAAGSVFRDVNIGASQGPASGAAEVAGTPFSEPIAAIPQPQRRPDVATLGDGTAFAVWEDNRDGCTLLYAARTRPLGTTGFLPARRIVAHGAEPRSPRVVARGDLIALVWQERSADDTRDVIRFARSIDGGRSFGVPLGVDGAMGNQWSPEVAIDPIHGTLLLAWIDTRSGIPQVRLAQSRDLGAHLDASEALAPASDRRHWSPSVALRDSAAVVVWSARGPSGDWSLEASMSLDGGSTFRAARTVTDRRIAGLSETSPVALAFVEEGRTRLGVGWVDHRRDRVGDDLRFARLANEGVSASVSVLGGVSSQPLGGIDWVERSDGALVTVWHALGTLSTHLWTSVSQDRGATFSAPRRLDDGPVEAQQSRPRIAAIPTRVGLPPRTITVSEDDREGPLQMRAQWQP